MSLNADDYLHKLKKKTRPEDRAGDGLQPIAGRYFLSCQRGLSGSWRVCTRYILDYLTNELDAFFKNMCWTFVLCTIDGQVDVMTR